MRLLGLILSLGAIVWVMYQVAGGGEAETMVPEAHQQSLEKAQNLEQTLQQDVQDRLQGLEED